MEYLAALMKCINYQPWISGAAQPKLTLDRLMSITIALPPAEEQAQIVQVQSEETGPLRAAIKQANRETTLLREFHTRLIADVVTGKLDVREAAARLPQDSEPMDAIDPDDDTDELNPEVEEPTEDP